MSQTATADEALMGPIEATLRRVIWRARAAIALRGALATLASGALAMLISTIIAAKWPVFEAWQHYALTALWVLSAGGAAAVMLLRPLARTFTLAGIARVIEQRHPELNERISSTVELLASDDSPQIRGSDALIYALAREAVSDVRGVQPRREISFRKARPFLIAFAATAGAIVALCAASSGMRKEFAKRLLPFLNLPNLYAEDLRISPGEDRVVAEGQSLEVKVSVARVNVRSAEFRIAQGDGRDQIVEMPRQPDGSFAYTTPPLKQSLEYRVRAGDAISRYYKLTVVPRPAVTGVEIKYDYPDYLRRPDTRLAACDGRIRAPAGSAATVRLHLNKPVKEARLFVNEATAELTKRGPLTYGFLQLLPKPATGTWRLELIDEYGNVGRASHEIVVTPDAPPTARILSPIQETLKLKPSDHVPILYAVHDDNGLSKAELLVSVDGRQDKAIVVPAVNVAAVAAQSRPEEAGSSEAILDLSRLELASARRVTFQLRAWDDLPKSLGGPQEGLSGVKTVELDVEAPSFVFQVQLALDLRIRETLERIYKELTQAKQLSEPLRRSMPATKQLTDKTIAKLDGLRKHLLSAEGDVRALAETTAGSTYGKLSETLVQLADRHIAPAREAAALIKITDDQKARAELASDEVDYHVDRALAIVSDLLKQFDVLTDLARRAVQLQELAEQQEALAAAKATPTTQPATAPDGEAPPAELTPGQWQQGQDQVARQTGQVVRQTPGALREALDRGGQRTRNLAEMAERLQRQQRALLAHTGEAERIRQMQQQLRQLAAEQAELARRASQLAQQAQPVEPTTQPAAQAAEQAQAAAEALTTTQPASAAAPQAAAERALGQTAQQAQGEVQRHAAAQLAEAAERMAREQARLAEQSEASRPQQQAAEAAENAAAQETARQQQVQAEVAGRLAELAKRQAALAAQAGTMEQAHRPPPGARPAEAMQRAASHLQQANPPAAAAEAEQASALARQLAGEMTRRAGAAAQAAQQANARAQKAAQDAQPTTGPSRAAAEQAAQAAAQQAGQAAQAARGQAQEAAKLADQQAELAKEIAAAAAREAPHLAQAQQAAQRAAAHRARAAEEIRQVAQAVGGTGQAQRQLLQQVGQLRQLAGQAAAQVQAAMQRHDPTGNMQRADKELAGNRPRQAASAQRSAEAQLRQIAQVARGAVPRTAAQRVAEQLAAAAEQMARRQDELTAQAAQQPQAAAAGQRQLAQQVGQLRRLAGRAGPAAQAAVRQHDPEPNMQRAAGELQQGRAAQAMPAQQAAGRQLRQIAQAARRQAAPAQPQRAAQIAHAAGNLAQQQRQLRQRTANLTRQLTAASAQLRQQELTRLQAEQQQIAREAAELADDVREQAPQPDRLGTHAARAAAAASQELEARRLAAAAESGHRAADMLGQVDRRLVSPARPEGQTAQDEPGQTGRESGEGGQESGQGSEDSAPGGAGGTARSGQVQAADPSRAQEPSQVAAEQAPTEAEQRTALAQRAGGLAARQRRLAREVAALADRQTPQLLASRQQRIAEGTGEVRRGAELIGDHVGDLMPDPAARRLAQGATEALRQAASAQASAEQAMTSGQPARSTQAQQTSAGALGRAGEALRRLGAHFSEQARAAPRPPQGQDALPGQLSEAHEATRSAAQSQAEADAARAARMLAALAALANRQAMAMGLTPMAGWPNQSPQGIAMVSDARIGSARAELTAAQLKKLGISLTNWARLPGELRDQVLQSAQLGGPEEYRTLIKRYFQAIAKLSAERNSKQEQSK